MHATKRKLTGKNFEIMLNGVPVGVIEREDGRVRARVWRSPLLSAFTAAGDKVPPTAALPSVSTVYHEPTRQRFEYEAGEEEAHAEAALEAANGFISRLRVA